MEGLTRLKKNFMILPAKVKLASAIEKAKPTHNFMFFGVSHGFCLCPIDNKVHFKRM